MVDLEKALKSLKDYLYNNRLPEAEIDRKLKEFASIFFDKGFKKGVKAQQFVQEKISTAKKKSIKRNFDLIFEELDDIHGQKIIRKKKR
jgi:hypothetical protein